MQKPPTYGARTRIHIMRAALICHRRPGRKTRGLLLQQLTQDKL